MPLPRDVFATNHGTHTTSCHTTQGTGIARRTLGARGAVVCVALSLAAIAPAAASASPQVSSTQLTSAPVSASEPAPEKTVGKPATTQSAQSPAQQAAALKKLPPAGLIVTFTTNSNNTSGNTAQQNQLQTLADALPANTTVRSMSLGRITVPTTPATYKQIKKTLKALPGVASVEPDSRVWPISATPEPATNTPQANTPNADTFATPQITKNNDPLRPKQWALNPRQGGVGKPFGEPTKPITVAVIDTGSIDHPELNRAWLPGADMISSPWDARDGDGRDLNARDEGDFRSQGDCFGRPAGPSSWHGAHVAGIVAAAGNNGIGITGAAPGTKIVPIRVLGRCGGQTSDIADGIVWAAGGVVPGLKTNKNPAKVINLSLGGYGQCRTATQDAINFARSRGAVVVVAAGNSAADSKLFYPASCAGTITVAATNRNKNLAFYSNYGTKVDVAAPGGTLGRGQGVLSTVLASKTVHTKSPSYKAMAGTSMAAPHVAALVAHMLAANPKLTPTQVERIITNTADPYQDKRCTGCRGGIINPAKAVAAAKNNTTYRNILPHGTFETGRNKWFQLRPGTITKGRNVKPHTGQYAAILGSRGAENTSLVSTRVTIPASARDAYLTYHFRVDSFDSRTETKDTMKVSVNGYHVITHTNKARRGKYRSLRVDLTEHIGKTITISFDAREDKSHYTRFTVDNVQLMVK